MTRSAVAVAALLVGCAPRGVTRERCQATQVRESADRFELVPALEGVGDGTGQLRTRVFLQLPPNGRIAAWFDAAQARWLVSVPEGTTADRVAEVPLPGAPDHWAVADVRGTTFDAAGERFHVLRPEGPTDTSTLFGWSWPRASPEANRYAQASMASAMQQGRGFLGDLAPAERASAIAHYGSLGDCAGCHLSALPPAAFERDRPLHRPTDARGLYSILATLEDDAPVERYRPVDPNLESPFVGYSCPSPSSGGPRRVPAERSAGAVRCVDGAVPWAHLEVARALGAGDGHAQALCRARRQLGRFLDDAGESAFHEALVECALSEAPTLKAAAPALTSARAAKPSLPPKPGALP